MVTVVVAVGILALVATVAYRSWIRSAYMAEAQDMLARIRTCEEAFHAENGQYLSVSKGVDLGNLYPADPPGAFKTAWGGACAHCLTPNGWTQLGVAPTAPVAFAYAVTAGSPTGTQGNALPTLTTTSIKAPDLTGLNAAPWYVAEAVGDINGDGVFTRVYTVSASSQLIVDNEGN